MMIGMRDEESDKIAERKIREAVRLPIIKGLIRRRILVNFRVDPQVALRQMPARFRPTFSAATARR